jgi:DNA modification methylase
MINKNGYIKVKAEYELIYADKEPKSSILTNTLEAPLQEVRVFNEGNEWEDGWRNMLIFGDNLLALKSLYEDLKEGGPNKYGLRNKIKLIYIDPPFATKSDFMKDKEKAYSDKVKGAKFIEFIRRRLLFLREILADDGTIYVHLDWKKSHYIKTILDEVFSEVCFLNNVVWCYKTRQFSRKYFNRKHDDILVYTKNYDQQIFNYDAEFVMEGYKEETIKKYKLKDENGYYRLCGRGIAGSPIKYLKSGYPPNDYWHIEIVNQVAIEREDYPTQKPENLLAKIIAASSNEGDIILDAFAGSGTSLAVAEKLNRKWIGFDCGKLSIYTIQKRFMHLTKHVGSVSVENERAIDRIENLDKIEQTRGMFIISEQAKKGQLDLNDDFLFHLHELLKNFKGMDEFSLVCPEEKFHLSKYEEDEDGVRLIKKDQITYKISFIEPKVKPLKSEPLKAKSFTLYNAGVYDKENILNLHWEQYKEFVIKLFEVRKNGHSINGFNVDGYIGVHSAYIWNYPEKKKIAIDEEYVSELHSYLKGKAGERFYVIAPTQSINFMQDEIKLGDTVYTFLKVPVSVLIRLIQSGELSSFKQPKSEENVNEVIDAFGFDFVSQPQVKYTLHKQKKKEGMFETDQFTIRLSEFYSDGLLYSPEDFKNFETLSLVLIDLDYEADPFTMDMHLWGKDLVKDETTPIEISIDSEKWKKARLAVILIDEYGNEKKLVLDIKDFK